jgi:hypothetical protein
VCVGGWLESCVSDDERNADDSTLKDEVLERAILALQIYRCRRLARELCQPRRTKRRFFNFKGRGLEESDSCIADIQVYEVG